MRFWSRFRVVGVAAIALPLLTAISSLPAQQSQPPKDRLTIADYFDWEDVGAPSLSPDGKQIIYTRTWIDRLNDKREIGFRATELVASADLRAGFGDDRVAHGGD